MLQKDPARRPSVQEVLTYLESLFDKSAAGIKAMNPQGVSMGTTTTIHSFSTFVFNEDKTGEVNEETKTLALTSDVAPNSNQMQTCIDIAEYLHASEVLTVCSFNIY